MKKALLIGDRAIAALHSIDGIDRAFEEILKGDFTLDVADETRYPSLGYGELSGYDLVIFMPEQWAKTATKDLVAALVTYVARGGSLFAVHHGLIAQNTYELELMFTARFSGHADYTALDFAPAAGVEGALAIPEVTLCDEPYLFDFDPLKATTVLAEFRYGARSHPAVWHHKWCKGHVACIAPGHSAESIRGFAGLIGALALQMTGKGAKA